MNRLISTVLAGGALVASSASATLIAAPTGPVHIKYSNFEQISATNAINNLNGGTEGNWGVFDISNINGGNNINPNTSFSRDNSNPLWAESDGGEYTGIFWGFQVTADPTKATGGFLDIYYDPNNDASSTATPTNRTGQTTFTGYTEGTLLVRLQFVPGAIEGDTSTTLASSCSTASVTYQDCQATLFANVFDKSGDGVIDAADGLWAAALDGNWFYRDVQGNGTAGDQPGERLDFSFANRFNNQTNWNGAAGTDIRGANSEDPVRGFGVPEPTSLALLGLSFLGLAAFRRARGN